MIKCLWIMGPIEYKDSGIGKYSELFKNELSKRIFIKSLYIPFKAKSIMRYFFQLIVWPIKLLSISKHYDCVILYEEKLFYLLPFIRSRKIIYIVHDVRFFKQIYKNNLYKFIFNYILRKNQNKLNIVVPSYFTKKEFIKLNYKLFNNFNLEIIFNPIDIKYDLLNKEELFDKYNIKDLVKNKKVLLYVGSEETRKNVITLLKILIKRKDFFLIKIGKPIINSNRKKLLHFIKENNIKNIKIIDYVNVNELMSFYKYSDVFIFPSLYEGFGRPPIESQIVGTPVISTASGSLKEVLGESAIFVNDPLNVDDYIKKIDYILNNKTIKDLIIDKGYKNARRYELINLSEKFYKLITR